MSEEFYIQNGFVGNAMAWWRIGDAGYGTDINEARRFTKGDALKLIKERDDFRAYPCALIDNLRSPARKTIIDCQYVSQKDQLAKEPLTTETDASDNAE